MKPVTYINHLFRTLLLLAAIGVILLALTGCPPRGQNTDTDNQPSTSEGQSEDPTAISQVAEEKIPDGPVRIAFVPSVEAGEIQLQLTEFDTKLSELLGHPVKSDVVLSYTACIEQMAAGHFEGAMLPTLAYVFAHERYGVRVVLKAVRNGSPTYRGEIIALAESPIQSIMDLKDRTMAFVEASSASGFLYPKTLLLSSGINPDTDLKEVTFVGSHNAVVEAVLQGRVDAGACYDDARTRFLETEPDIMEKTRVVAYTAAIPSDTFSLREDCTGPFYDRLVNALVQLSSEGKESVLFRIYQIEGLVPAVDSDYDPVRQMVQTLNLDLQTEVDKKE